MQFRLARLASVSDAVFVALAQIAIVCLVLAIGAGTISLAWNGQPVGNTAGTAADIFAWAFAAAFAIAFALALLREQSEARRGVSGHEV